jgi:hypothetical protein
MLVAHPPVVAGDDFGTWMTLSPNQARQLLGVEIGILTVRL